MAAGMPSALTAPRPPVDGAARLLPLLLLLSTWRAPLPGEQLLQLRADPTLRDLSGLIHRLHHGVGEIGDAFALRTAHRPVADASDWLAWQWFGLDPELHRVGVVAVAALAARSLGAGGAWAVAFLAHPLVVDAAVTRHGRHALLAVALGELSLGARAAWARRLGPLAVAACAPWLLPWHALEGWTRADPESRRAHLLACAAALALALWGLAPPTSLTAPLHALRVAALPWSLAPWRTLAAPDVTNAALALLWAVACAGCVAQKRWAAALSATLLLVGAAFGAAPARGVVDGAFVVAALAVVSLLRAALPDPRPAGVAVAVVSLLLGGYRAWQWRHEPAVTAAALRVDDPRTVVAHALSQIRAGREARCGDGGADPAARCEALACEVGRAALAGEEVRAREGFAALGACAGEVNARDAVGRVLALRPRAERDRARALLGITRRSAP